MKGGEILHPPLGVQGLKARGSWCRHPTLDSQRSAYFLC